MAVSSDTAGDLLGGVSRLVRTARSYAHLQQQQLGRAGLPHGVLLKLAHGPLRPGDLATLLHVSPSAVSRTVATLVDEGWVERRTDPSDGRACTLALSPAGVERLRTARVEQARLLTELLQDWDDERAATLAALLGELSEALEHAVDLGRRTGPTGSTHSTVATVPSSATPRPQEVLA